MTGIQVIKNKREDRRHKDASLLIMKYDQVDKVKEGVIDLLQKETPQEK